MSIKWKPIATAPKGEVLLLGYWWVGPNTGDLIWTRHVGKLPRFFNKYTHWDYLPVPTGDDC